MACYFLEVGILFYALIYQNDIDSLVKYRMLLPLNEDPAQSKAIFSTPVNYSIKDSFDNRKIDRQDLPVQLPESVSVIVTESTQEGI